MTTTNVIEGRVTLGGVAAVRAGLLALGSESQRLRGRVSTTSNAIRSDFSRIVSGGINPAAKGLQSLQGVVAGLSLAAFAGQAVGLYKTIQAIVKATVDMEGELNRLAIDSQAWNIKERDGTPGAARLAALEQMFGAATGRDQGDGIQDLYNRIIDYFNSARDGNEAAQKTLSRVNLSLSTVYKAGTDELKDMEDGIKSISASLMGADEDMKRSFFTEMLGRRQAGNGLRLFGMTPQQIDDYVADNIRIRNITEESLKWGATLNYARDRAGAAQKGLYTALGNGYADAYIALVDNRTRFMSELFDDAESIGSVFGDFSLKVSGRLQEFTTKILELLKGTGKSIESGPLPAALYKVADLIGWTLTRVEEFVGLVSTGTTDVGWLKVIKAGFDAVRAGAGWAAERTAELMAFLETGKTDVPWVNLASRAFEALSDAITWVQARAQEFSDYLNKGETEVEWVNDAVSVFNTLKAAINGALEAIFAVAKMFGIDSTWEKAALITGMILFRGTLLSLIPLMSSFIARIALMSAGIVKASAVAAAGAGRGVVGAAAAGTLGAAAGTVGAGLAAAGGIYYGSRAVAKDIVLKKEIEKALEQSRTIAEEKGEAAGAGYLKAMLDYLKTKYGNGEISGAISGAIHSVFGSEVVRNFDEFQTDIDAKINISNAQEAAAGARLAFTQIEQIPLTDLIDIGGGIMIPKVDLEANALDGVFSVLEDMPASVLINDVQFAPGVGVPSIAPAGRIEDVSAQTSAPRINSSIELNINGTQMPPIPTTEDYARRFESSAEQARRNRL